MNAQSPSSYPRPFGGRAAREVLAVVAGPDHAFHTAVELLPFGVVVCSCKAKFRITHDSAVLLSMERADVIGLLTNRLPPSGAAPTVAP